MIIKTGDTITIRARVSPDSGIRGGSITWEPVTEGLNAETVARAVNAHDALLDVCRYLLDATEQPLSDAMRYMVLGEAAGKARRAIIKAKGR